MLKSKSPRCSPFRHEPFLDAPTRRPRGAKLTALGAATPVVVQLAARAGPLARLGALLPGAGIASRMGGGVRYQELGIRY